MGNQQSNAGAAKFFAGVTDAIVSPINMVAGPIIPSASAAVAASNDPNINANAGKNTAAAAMVDIQTAGPNSVLSKIRSRDLLGRQDPNKPPPNMMCFQATGQDKPTRNGETGEWYCGTGNDGDRVTRRDQGLIRGFGDKVAAGAPVGVGGNNPTPGPTNEWTGGGGLLNNPPGVDYSVNRGPQQMWTSRPGDGVTPPGSQPVQMPRGQAPMSDDPQQLNPEFNLSGSMDPGNKTVLGGDANSLSVHQGFPNLNASPALPQPAATPAMDTTTLVIIGGAVVVGAVLLAKKR
jgi:hypothetical protein